ncbi:MAG: HipA domain-containing protein [Bacteroidetes bacterium]|nr:HipA domain-containing protein [Bacteroidota bacterium]
MALPELLVCPGDLSVHAGGYSRAFRRRMFAGRTVSHILPYHSPDVSESDIDLFLENRKHFSLSGIQVKWSLIQEKNKLRLTRAGERGTHILKPIPTGLKRVDQIPANEHVTMQIARQVFGISTAENGLIFFKDGSPAFLTKRFDISSDGTKLRQEDFAALADRSALKDGPDFKYEYSYEELADLLKRFVPAYTVEIEKYFRLILFNYLFSNGDAHLKNFSLLETSSSDFILSPAYDLLDTRIHVSDNDFALHKGLFSEPAGSPLNHPDRRDFIRFGERVGIQPFRMEQLIHPFTTRQDQVSDLVSRSFLNESTQRAYMLHYNTRRNLFNNGD